MSKKKTKEKPLVKLDLGCGKNKREGFLGVDQYKLPGVDKVANLTKKWPWDDNSVDEVNASHFIEHLTAVQRCFFMNELYRVLKPGATATIIVPHWASCRAYGDPTHQWPPVGEFFFYYLNKEWREGQTPHVDKKNWPDGYDCNFNATWGYALNPAIASRSQEWQQFAINHYREAAHDIIATLTKL
jgi:hypothetical protein